VSAIDLWAHLGDVRAYPSWWSWLRSFDATRLAAGERWQCTVQPPLPYRVRFDVHLDVVEPCERIEARVSGDIAGTASLVIVGHGNASAVRLRSDLAPDSTWLRVASALFGPVVRHGHQWVLDTGARQFTDRAL
jgi:hypothetical protein